jgi:hypothetical protein
MAVESTALVNHEEIADHALLLSEAADVLLDMAMSPGEPRRGPRGHRVHPG